MAALRRSLLSRLDINRIYVMLRTLTTHTRLNQPGTAAEANLFKAEDNSLLLSAAAALTEEVHIGSLHKMLSVKRRFKPFESNTDGWGVVVGNLLANNEIEVTCYIDNSWRKDRRVLWIGLATEDNTIFEELLSKIPPDTRMLSLSSKDARLRSDGQWELIPSIRRQRSNALFAESYPDSESGPVFYLGLYDFENELDAFFIRAFEFIAYVANGYSFASARGSGSGLTLTEPPPPSPIKERVKPITPKIVDWMMQDEKNRKLGLLAEQCVLNEEKKRLIGLQRPDLAEKVVHVSQVGGDGLGYDILSFDENGEPIHIEVKATCHGKDTPFFISANELTVFKQSSIRHLLVRVYEFNIAKGSGKYFIIRDFDDMQKEPINYRAWI